MIDVNLFFPSTNVADMSVKKFCCIYRAFKARTISLCKYNAVKSPVSASLVFVIISHEGDMILTFNYLITVTEYYYQNQCHYLESMSDLVYIVSFEMTKQTIWSGHD